MAGMGSLGSYRELIGLAAARIEVRALRVVMIPALAIDTVCCSCLSAHVSCIWRKSLESEMGSDKRRREGRKREGHIP